MSEFTEFLKESKLTEDLDLMESWDAKGIESQIGGYGLNSPLGTFYVKKSTGNKVKVNFSNGAKNGEKFTGTSEEAAKWLNGILGL